MPHLTLEYSANLDGQVDMAALCVTAADTILESGLFETGAVRVRAVRCEAYAIADRAEENAFIDLSFRIGTGRSAAEKRRVGDALFAAVSGRLGDLFATPHFALSLEIREIDGALSWKRNAIHSRLRDP